MSSPRTLPALRVAVARVLQARGEAADALVCAVVQHHRIGWYATVSAVACNTVVDWLAIGGGSRGEAVGADGDASPGAPRNGSGAAPSLEYSGDVSAAGMGDASP